jgi:O-antigen ligase
MESTPASLRFRWAYILTGLVWGVLSVGPMACQETGGIGLGVAVLVSALIVWPVLKPLRRQPLLILLVVWGAWISLSLLWSPVHGKGNWDLASLRFAWTIPVMWPLMRDRPKFIAAIALGFFLGNLSQLSLWCGHHFNIHALAYKEFSPGNRNPGWWTHPAEAGNILVGALGLHLPAALMGTGRPRWIAIGGCIVTWAGMIATGTRGAWLAGLALMLVVVCVAIFSGRWKWQSVRWGLAIAAVVGVVGWVTLGDFISRRAQTGITEVQNALNHGDYQSDTGARIKLAQLGFEMFKQHPIFGAGAGCFQPYAEKRLREEGADMEWWADRPGSAHNAWIHIAATIGLVGVAIAAAIVWFSLRVRRHLAHPPWHLRRRPSLRPDWHAPDDPI